MNRKEKEQFIAEFKDRLQKAHATFLVDYQGLNVEAMNSLRKELKENGIEFQVVKNRLLKLACQDTETVALKDHFTGPCAMAITYEDAVSPAKILVGQSKELKNLEIKVGQIGGKVIDFAAVKKLAELPGREILLAQALSALQGVPTAFVRVLNGVMLNLIYALKAVEKQKAEGGAQ